MHRPASQHRGMQLLEPSMVRPRAGLELRRLPGLLVGAALIGAGLWVGLREIADGSLAGLLAVGRASSLGMLGGAIAWTFGVVGPALLVLLGSSRLVRSAGRYPRRTAEPFLKIARALPGDRIVAVGLRLPDGRRIQGLTVGPEGVVVFGQLPPPNALRVSGPTWQVRAGDGWRPVDEPLNGARRDADAVRRWLGEIPFDPPLVVRAAVVDPYRSKRRPDRTPSSGACPLLGPDEVARHLESLPEAARLTPGRQEQLVARLRSAMR